MEMMEETILAGWALLLEMAPYLLLGFLFAGILSVLISAKRVAKHLGKPGFFSSLKAAAIGVPLPLCSCGVIPTGVSFYKNGAGKGATNAFLISTPQTGVDSILLTYTMMGPAWAITRPVVALVTGVFGGVLTDQLDRGEQMEAHGHTHGDESKHPWYIAIFKYAFFDFLSDISRPLIVGILLAIAIAVLIPPGFFTTYLNYPILNMLLILAVSVPLYVCATGSIPVGTALLMAGVSPGAVLVFLMAGPATNITTFTVLWRSIGKRSTLVYLFSIICGALTFGLLIDYVLPTQWFRVNAATAGHSHHSHGWFSAVCAVLLIALIVYAELKKLLPTKVKSNNMTKEFKVTGMTCNHCKKAVEDGIMKVPGVKSVVAYPAENKVSIEGEVSPEMIKKTIQDLGYQFGS